MVVSETSLFVFLHGSANEIERDLAVRAYGACKRLSSHNTLTELSAGISWTLLLVVRFWIVLIQVLQTFQETKVKLSRLRAIIDQKGGVLTSFAEVQGTKVKRTLLTTAFFEYDGELLLDTSGHYFNGPWLVLTFDVDMNESRNQVGLGGL